MDKTTYPAQEPVITVGSIGALAAALLTLLAAFGLPVSVEVQTAILGFIAVAAPLVVAVVARRWVSPAWKVEQAEARTSALEVANQELHQDRAELAKALAEEQQNNPYGYTEKE